MSEIKKLNEQDISKVVGGISQDEALAAALKHAGFAKNELDFLKRIKLDWEHGRKVYEISFYKNGFEYEYDIDATTGNILKVEKDRD